VLPVLHTDDVVGAVVRRGPSRSVDPILPEARHSAVLIALADGPDGAEVVLTRRSKHLRNHRGEVAFPGGRTDPGETPVQAALREAWEEVLLDPGLVHVVGELDHLSTVASGSHIVPIVGRLAAPPELRPGTSEVDRVFAVPLAELLSERTYREERWGTPPLDRTIHFFELHGDTVWGATARMLLQLLTIALGLES
jgi:8-oxo-dGTP pyrophosphatase MutT (NUDIX family)